MATVTQKEDFPTKKAAENLYKGSKKGSPDKITDRWYGEVDDCDWSTGCEYGVNDAVVGHFTALIWKGTKVIACSYSDTGLIAACRYGGGPASKLSCKTPNMAGCYMD